MSVTLLVPFGSGYASLGLRNSTFGFPAHARNSREMRDFDAPLTTQPWRMLPIKAGIRNACKRSQFGQTTSRA